MNLLNTLITLSVLSCTLVTPSHASLTDTHVIHTSNLPFLAVEIGSSRLTSSDTSPPPIVLVQPFGANSLRVRTSLDGSPINDSLPGALIPPSHATDATAVQWFTSVSANPSAFITVTSNTITNGNIKAVVDSTTGLVTVTRVSDGTVVLQESAKSMGPVSWSGGVSVGATLTTAATTSSPGVYGFGEHQYGRLNRVGQSFNMEQCLEYGHSRGGEVCLPFILTGSVPNAFQPGTDYGCFKDSSDRLLPYVAAVNVPNMSRNDCVLLCGQAGYKVSGAEAGGQCYCGNTVPPSSASAPESDCSSPCTGNSSQTCGGPWHLQAVAVSASPSTKPGAITAGFLWNQPNYGSAAFGPSGNEWVAVGAVQIDYWVGTDGASHGGPADILNSYVDSVGHAPVLPEFAAGYWHSRNRYASQAELLAAAAGFHQRNLSVEIIVIDYHHWPKMGDYSFDPTAWPDPEAMVKQLTEWGMRVMVSVWPFSSPGSTTFDAFTSKDLVVNMGNTSTPSMWDDNNCDNGQCVLYDPTQEAARGVLWSALEAGYVKYNISIFWLDAAEPEISTSRATAAANNGSWSFGPLQNSLMMFPYMHTRSIHDGLVSRDLPLVMLTRSAWAGMQRWGAALWSGDTQSTFSSLQVSVQAGLATQLSGIAWWTTDIGGYSGGNPADPTFRELIVRWFQYGVTCPLFRQHGARHTEPWLLGNTSYADVVKAMELRQTLRPYVMDAMKAVASTGLPVNRPLWFDFPEDVNTWSINDEYMFGPSYLVAPVTELGARNKTVYLPGTAQTVWTHYFTSKTYEGGQTVVVDAPLDHFPLFKLMG